MEKNKIIGIAIGVVTLSVFGGLIYHKYKKDKEAKELENKDILTPITGNILDIVQNTIKSQPKPKSNGQYLSNVDAVIASAGKGVKDTNGNVTLSFSKGSNTYLATFYTNNRVSITDKNKFKYGVGSYSNGGRVIKLNGFVEVKTNSVLDTLIKITN